MGKRALVWILFVVVGLAASACGGGTTTAPTATSTLTGTATPTVVSTSEPTPTATSVPVATSTPTQPSPGPQGTPGVAQAATLEVRVTDAPPEQVTKILITVSDIRVSRRVEEDAAGWVTLIPGPVTFDLVAVTGIEEILGDSQVDPGRYNQIRMNVDKVVVTLDGADIEARVPSEVLRIVGGFDAFEGETTILTLDFDAARSVVVTGRGNVQLKPVVKLLVRKGNEDFSKAQEAPGALEPEPTETPEETGTPTPPSIPGPASTPTPTATLEPVATATPTLTATPKPGVETTVTLVPSKDNTLYNNGPGSISNGAGDFIFAGTNRRNEARRGLLAFDIAGSIPEGSTIMEVRLTLFMSRSERAGPESVTLHRLERNWGEGSSNATGNEGGGAQATAGDATWTHTILDRVPWRTPGGDFAAGSSAEVTVGDIESYTWGSTSQLVADVQAWVDDAGANFGWLVMGNEGASPTAKRFDSRENPSEANRPVLEVVFIPGS